MKVHGVEIEGLSRVKVWKDGAWRVKYTLAGKPCELSYPGEFGEGFFRFVQDSIFNHQRVHDLLAGRP